jgi:hypothetical protein
MELSPITRVREAFEEAYGKPSGAYVLLGALAYHVPDEVLERLLQDALKEVENSNSK